MIAGAKQTPQGGPPTRHQTGGAWPFSYNDWGTGLPPLVYDPSHLFPPTAGLFPFGNDPGLFRANYIYTGGGGPPAGGGAPNNTTNSDTTKNTNTNPNTNPNTTTTTTTTSAPYNPGTDWWNNIAMGNMLAPNTPYLPGGNTSLIPNFSPFQNYFPQQPNYYNF